MRRGADVWILPLDDTAVPLGGALAWCASHDLPGDGGNLRILSGARPGELGAAARRAGEFGIPVEVWRLDGDEPEPVDASLPHLDPPVAPAVWDRFADALRGAGTDVVAEAGALRAEVLGLEVARVVEGPGGEPKLEVGVGRHDREAYELLRAEPTIADVAAAAEVVRGARVEDAPSSPASQLALERWLRTVVLREPALAGARLLEPAPSPVERTDLRRRAPAPAVGEDESGGRLVVVCSVGVDPELVPLAADARLSAAARWGIAPGDARLRLVVPDGDDHPITWRLAALLRSPAEVRTVGAGWRRA